MNSTIDATGLAQAYETTFKISDYVNFDFDFDAPHESVYALSDNSLAHPFQSMVVYDPYVGFVDEADTQLASIFQAPCDCNALGISGRATHTASEDLAMTDAVGTAVEIDASRDDFRTFEPTAFALEIPDFSSKLIPLPKAVLANPLSPNPSKSIQKDSIWLPVSPQLQQHLNTVYASDLAQQLNVPTPAPVLFFPAEQPLDYPTSSIHSPLNDVYETSQTLQSELESTSISPSLLMHERPTLPQDLFSNELHSPHPQTIDKFVLDVEDSASAPLRKRTLDTDEVDPEPASKRTRIAQAEVMPTVAKDDDTDDDEPVVTRRRIARQKSTPVAVKDDHSVDESRVESESEFEHNCDDRSCDSDSSGSSSALSSTPLPPTPVMRAAIPASPPTKQVAHGPNWRYERAQEARLREQRKQEWNQRRMTPLGAKGQAPSRKTRKWLEEIEDSEGFAEAQGYRAEERVECEEDRCLVRRRPVRKGARKSYVGQD